MSEALEAFIDESIRLSQARGYHPAAFIEMRARWTTRGAIERLIRAGRVQAGAKRLKELDLLEWSIEAAVLRFPEDFPDREIREAARLTLNELQRAD